jgi:hypothetical protein
VQGVQISQTIYNLFFVGIKWHVDVGSVSQSFIPYFCTFLPSN